jgi:hypothetical protein
MGGDRSEVANRAMAVTDPKYFLTQPLTVMSVSALASVSDGDVMCNVLAHNISNALTLGTISIADVAPILSVAYHNGFCQPTATDLWKVVIATNAYEAIMGAFLSDNAIAAIQSLPGLTPTMLANQLRGIKLNRAFVAVQNQL